jgi:hypothetical protein
LNGAMPARDEPGRELARSSRVGISLPEHPHLLCPIGASLAES